jgi:hypothetical protein
MIDPDRYWAASGLLARTRVSAPPSLKTKPSSGIASVHLDGGCVLYRLPAARNDADIDGTRAIPDFLRTRATAPWASGCMSGAGIPPRTKLPVV